MLLASLKNPSSKKRAKQLSRSHCAFAGSNHKMSMEPDSIQTVIDVKLYVLSAWLEKSFFLVPFFFLFRDTPLFLCQSTFQAVPKERGLEGRMSNCIIHGEIWLSMG
ncbi:hypothetical protein CEXT_116221 [Caerostris extrusa]|uniref:Uncharacterized protein n=1 Tax=Caerostris extrusa TaxID=172846 RepID=A0AAV4WXN4_CAEEX|nr:hypothetical protein CEXT_116221 [Caerostris extrusa]